MKRDDGALYAIALVAAGAAAGMAAKSMRETQGSRARSTTKDLAVGRVFAGIMVKNLPRVAALLGAPVPGARVTAAILILLPLMYTIGQRKIERFLSLDRGGQVKMIRRHAVLLMTAPATGAIVYGILRDDGRARQICAKLDAFLRENKDISPEELEVSLVAMSEQYAALKGAGSRAVAPGLGHLLQLLASLHALRWLYHASHWKAAGPSFYGDHQLFERLYKGDPSIDDQIDMLAEKVSARFGASAIDPVALQQSAASILSKAVAEGSTAAEHGLSLERSIQKLIEETQAVLKANDSLSLGLDDFLMGLASERETSIYLLKQRSEGHG
jgi:DNA-binding ferritin-like protein